MGRTAASEHLLHVAMFPWFAFGHIRPFVDLTNKLSSHGIKISFLTPPGNIPRIKTMLDNDNNNNVVDIVPLQIPQVPGLPPGLDSTADITPPMQELLKQALDLMKPQVKEILTQLKPQFVFFDFAQHWLPELVSDLNIHTLFFSVFSAISTAYLPFRTADIMNSDVIEVPTVDELKVPPQGGHPESPLFSPLRDYEARDYMYVYKRFNGPSVVDRLLACLKGCSALVKKSCNEMEGKYIGHTKERLQKPVLLTGALAPPLTSVGDQLEEKWEKWLREFPKQSVVYCSFGSETFLRDDQIKELALGLELSGLPFILVLNFPCDVDATSELTRTLPEGFMERVRDRGVVHTGWVQQRLILAHPHVGCYLCHSGYSSVIEAMMYDCQMVLLPLKGDQFLNCKLVSEDLKAGVAIQRREEDGYFGKNDVYEAIKKVMTEVDKEPGKTIRTNQKMWRDYLLNEEAQDKHIFDLVEQLKAMV